MNNIAFKPYYNKDSKVLILGSFPSIKSRQDGFYYGNKQNRFWKTIANIFEEPLPTTIIEKQTLLNKYKIALYDIVEKSPLKGSSDLELQKDYTLISNLDKLLPPYTKVEKIICNGKLAYNLTIQNFNLQVPVIYMQSTSPANPRYNLKDWLDELIFLK